MARRSTEQVDAERMAACVSCKIGTVPDLVEVHGRDRIAVGERIRVRGWQRGSKWRLVNVTEVHPDGFFKAALT